MIPISDDISKCWYAKGTWLLILTTSTISTMALSSSEQSQLQLINTFGVSSNPRRLLDTALCMFVATHLHADYAHLFFNMLFLFVFGLSLEKAFGTCCFLLLYYAAAFSGWILYFCLDHSQRFAIGASGAVSGVITGYLILFPRAKVLSAVLILWVLRFFYIRAWVYIGIWIVIQVLSSIYETQSHIAYTAHLGGVLLGLLLGSLFRFRYFRES